MISTPQICLLVIPLGSYSAFPTTRVHESFTPIDHDVRGFGWLWEPFIGGQPKTDIFLIVIQPQLRHQHLLPIRLTPNLQGAKWGTVEVICSC